MARLQKKKITVKPRKKDGPGDSEVRTPSENHQVTAEKSDTLAAGAAAEKLKKAYTVKKPSGLDQSAVMRLAEKYFGNWIQFLREVRVELTKVTWPSKKQTIGSTAVVIVFVFIVAFFLGIVDIGLSSFIRLFL